jgi:serine/threonine protein kinase
MRVGNYELVTQLASGGMAETHIARSTVDNSIVVIKQLLPRYAGNAEFIEMFVDEGRVISSLKHPNVVAMREFGFQDELPFLAMEYLHGVDLRTLSRTLALRKKRQMSVDVALYIACAMCAGLHHAHEARTIDGKPMDITHRDVSPQNVVLTFDGDVKLIDFGIATARGRTHETRSGALKGKIPYMAPEQVRAGATDRRTDVYAVGVVLYEMLTAKRPYVGKKKRMGEFSLMMAIVNHDVIPVDALRLDLPPSLTKVIMKAMSLHASDRYQTASELESALRAEGRRLGLVLDSHRLSTVMVEVLGERKPAGQIRTNAEVMALHREVEHAKTKVDEAFDPETHDASEMKSIPASILTTGQIPVTDKGAPPFEDVIENAATVEAAAHETKTIAVDKVVEANVTRLRFHQPIAKTFRWQRFLDGIEGALEIDFSGAGDLSATAVAAATVAIHGLPPEVSEVRLVAVPIGLATQLDDRCAVLSVSCAGRCPKCDETSIAILAYDELRTRLASGSDIPCSRCNTGLVEIELAPLASWASRSSIKMPIVPAPSDRPSGELPYAQTASMSAQMPAPQPPVTRSRAIPARHRKWMPAYIGLAFMAICMAALVIVLLTRSKRARTVPPAPVSIGDGKSWHDRDDLRLEVIGDGVDDSAALAEARRQAMRIVLLEIEKELPTAIRELTASAKDAAAVANFEAHEDARRLELVTSSVVREGVRAKATTNYKFANAAIDRARTYYAARKEAWGVVLVNAPPSRAPGVLVLSAPANSPVAAGDRIVSAGGQPLESLASVTSDLLRHDQLELVVERTERKKLAVRGRAGR